MQDDTKDRGVATVRMRVRPSHHRSNNQILEPHGSLERHIKMKHSVLFNYSQMKVSSPAPVGAGLVPSVDPGDGSDTVEGQDGTDTMLFNGANAAEQVDLSANGNRLKFLRTQGNVTMDTAGVELVDFNALGGADLVTVNDLSGTDVRSVNVDLAGTLGGAIGDGQPDRVVLNATNGDDTIRVFGDATEVTAKGLAPLVGILHPEVANDRLEINTLAGNDTVDSSGLAAGAIQLFVDGVLVP